MSNQKLIQAGVDKLINDMEVNETLHDGLTARDVCVYIKGTHGVIIPTEEIIEELIRNDSLELAFRLKEG